MAFDGAKVLDLHSLRALLREQYEAELPPAFSVFEGGQQLKEGDSLDSYGVLYVRELVTAGSIELRFGIDLRLITNAFNIEEELFAFKSHHQIQSDGLKIQEVVKSMVSSVQ